MSHKIWIALTTLGLLFLPFPSLPAGAARPSNRLAEVAAPNGLGSTTAKPIEISPLPTVTTLKVTELSTQAAMVQPEVAPIPVVAFVEQPEQKMRQTAGELGSALKTHFVAEASLPENREQAAPQASLDRIQPTQLPNFFPKPSRVLGEAANKEVSREPKAASANLGPLDSEPVETNPLPTTPEVKPAETVLQSQTGIASWYGYEAGNQTASGERYNAQAMTAAHRTLPFGTRVRVTNLRSGKSAIVRINDRGPFIRGRIIDLSAVAADAVGIKSSGVGNVRVDVLSYGSSLRDAPRTGKRTRSR